MNCRQFRETYSDFADGLLDEAAEVRCHVHLAECPSCRRFVATLKRGLSALRGLEAPAPSEGFDERLLARLATEKVEAPETRLLVGMAGTVLALAVVGAIGWEAHTWIAPAEPIAPPVAGRPVPASDPYVVRLAGERPFGYRSRFSVIPVSRDSSQRNRPAQPVEVTVDWMAP